VLRKFSPKSVPTVVECLDSTLREGCQAHGVGFTLQAKIKIALMLDDLGVHVVEAGWPGASPLDRRLFKALRDYSFTNSKLAAFTSTRRKDVRVEEDANLNAVLEAGVDVAVVFGKSWSLHVEKVLKASLQENLDIVAESVEYLKQHGLRVVFDAEHFFDGFRENPEYSLTVLEAAVESGADTVVLADTNGGQLPHQVYQTVSEVVDRLDATVGVHMHNDSGNAVANTLMAVLAGASHVQVTVNGLGERCGNADLCQVVPNLYFKMGVKPLKVEDVEQALRKLTNLSRTVYRLGGVKPNPYQPYVGEYAFSHKAGVHVDAVLKERRAYEHIPPKAVGNVRRMTVSELAGRTAVVYALLEELGLRVAKRDERVAKTVEEVKALALSGVSLDEAQSTVALILLKQLGLWREMFRLSEWRIVSESVGGKTSSWSWVKVEVGDREEVGAGEGVGPVHAADVAIRGILERFYPELKDIRLIDYRVILPEAPSDTASLVRVYVDFTDGRTVWSTTAASKNIVEASIQAILDGLDYYLQRKRTLKH